MIHLLQVTNMRKLFVFYLLMILMGLAGCLEIENPVNGATFQHRAEIHFSVDATSASNVVWTTTYTNESGQSVTVEVGRGETFDYGGLPIVGGQITRHKIKAKRGNESDESTIYIKPWCLYETADCSSLNHGCLRGVCDPVPDVCTTQALHTLCDDGNVCNGEETCNALTGGCVESETLDCDDGVPCTIDSCYPEEGCDHIPNAEICDDGIGCTVDICDSQDGCSSTADDSLCNDGDPCTVDVCGPEGCTNEPVICNTSNHEVCVNGQCVCDPTDRYYLAEDGETCICDVGTSCEEFNAECGTLHVGCGETMYCGECDPFSTCEANNRCSEPAIPPDPAERAEELDPTSNVSVCGASLFLVDTDDAVQKVPSAATALEDVLDCEKIVHIYGAVTDSNGTELSGVRVSVNNHPEYGLAVSRADGKYDVLANGGELMTLRFTKSGFLPVQRKVPTPWEDFAAVDTVILTETAPSVPAVLGLQASQMQIVDGEIVADDDGTRQARLMIPPETQAIIHREDGTEIPLDGDVHISMTEYTVGDNGPNAMPGDLPPTTSYTYAVELGIEEAGGDHVEFDRPLAYYVDNFLGFKPGTPVPVGFYDEIKDQWVASEDGVVLKVIDVVNGMAVLQMKSDDPDTPEDESAFEDEEEYQLYLDYYRIEDQELVQLAQRYEPGESFWRAPIRHFSTADLNFPLDIPDDPRGPQKTGNGSPDDPDDFDPPGKEPEEYSCKSNGSIIECDNMILGEKIDLEGVPFSLHYQSDRVYGWKAGRTLEIPVAGDDPVTDEDFRGAFVTLNVWDSMYEVPDVENDQRRYGLNFPNRTLEPHETRTVVWNQLDRYRNFVNGTRLGVVTIVYVYFAYYKTSPFLGGGGSSGASWRRDQGDFTYFASFGEPSGEYIDGADGRVDYYMTTRYPVKIGLWDQKRGHELGGWSLTPLHAYDPVSRTVYKGDGSRMYPAEKTITDIPLPDNNPEFAIRQDHQGRLLKMRRNRLYTSFTSTSNENILFETADGSYIADVAFDKQGVMYFLLENSSHTTYPAVYRKAPEDDEVTVFAGRPNIPGSLDGDRSEARFTRPIALDVDAEGAIYVLDRGTISADIFENRNHVKVRKIMTNGRVLTLAGTENMNDFPSCAQMAENQGFEGFLTDCHLGYPTDLVVEDDGTVYVASMHVQDDYATLYWRNAVYKIHPTGELELFAGGGYLKGEIEGTVCHLSRDAEETIGFEPGESDDVRAPGSAMGIPEALALDRRGNVYISEQSLFTLCHTDRNFGESFWYSRRQGGVIRRVRTSGVTERMAGKYDSLLASNGYGRANNAATGEKALDVIIWPQSMVIDPAGNLYFQDTYRRESSGTSTNYTYYLRSIKNNTPLPPNVYIPQGGTAVPSRNGSEVYIFDSNGNHWETVLASTGETIYEFNTTFINKRHLVTSIFDAWGNETKILRNEETGNITGIESPTGLTTTIGTNDEGYISSITDPGGNSYQFTYYVEPYVNEQEGLLATMTDPNGGVYEFEFDDLGRLIKDKDPEGGVKTLTLAEKIPGDNGASVQLDTLVDGEESSGTWLSKTYKRLDPLKNDGQFIREVTLPSGLTGQSVTDEEGRSTVTLADGTVITKTMSPDPRFGYQVPYASLTKIIPPGGTAMTMTMSRSYDAGAGTTGQSLTVGGNTWRLSYDEDTNTRTWTSPLGIVTTLVSNDFDQPVTLSRPGLADVTYTYDDNGRLTEVRQEGDSAGHRGYNMTYDSNGRLLRLNDAGGHTTTYHWDDAGRLSSVDRADRETISYDHDANGNFTGLLTPESTRHTMEYSSVDLENAFTSPLSVERTEYNKARQVTRVENTSDSSSKYMNFTYDDYGRLDYLEAGSRSIEIIYDSTSGQVKQLVTKDDIVLEQDLRGSLNYGESWSGSGLPFDAAITFVYNTSHQMSSLSTGSERVSQQFTYDADGRLTGAGTVSSRDLVMTYTDFGAVSSLTTKKNDNEKLVETFSYNDFGEEKSRAFKDLNGDVLYAQVFEREESEPGMLDGFRRDNLGRIREMVETIEGVETEYIYIYDLVGNLIKVIRNGEVIERYAYDANGNRTPGGEEPEEVWEYDEDDRLIQAGNSSFSYTANGSLRWKTGHSYNYDNFGNLRQTGSITYLIDGKNRRVGRVIDDEFEKGWIYKDGLNPVAEIGPDGSITAEFVYGKQGHVPELMIRDGVKYRIVTDHRGSVRLVVNVQTGDIAQRIDYTTWGDVVSDTNPGFQPFGFAGGLYDEYTGLVRFGARDYDPEVGRWTAKDPIRWDGGQVNLYVYVGNDPVNGIDPSGEIDQQMCENPWRAPTKKEFEKYTSEEFVCTVIVKTVCSPSVIAGTRMMCNQAPTPGGKAVCNLASIVFQTPCAVLAYAVCKKK